jgi:hypothetical protein
MESITLYSLLAILLAAAALAAGRWVTRHKLA